MPDADRPAALLSLSDKTGADGFGTRAPRARTAIYATGGTRAYLEAHGVPARDVGDMTGFPALFGGRVKTLHPKIFGGIFYDRDDEAQRAEARTYNDRAHSHGRRQSLPVRSDGGAAGNDAAEAIEQIDIGGVSLLRAAAKNFEHVAVLTHPSQYAEFLRALEDGDDRLRHAPEARGRGVRAHRRVRRRDLALSCDAGEVLPSELPGALALTLPLAKRLRYGTNPQERAAFYLDRARAPPRTAARQSALLQQPARSRRDVAPALARAAGRRNSASSERCVRAAVVKHTVPCGVAERLAAAAAVRDALAADPISAYGGIVAVDARDRSRGAPRSLAAFFLEIVAAPAFDADALALLRKKKNLRVMRFPPTLPDELARELRVRSALGGVLAEDDDPDAPAEHWRVASRRGSRRRRSGSDLAFAWDVVRHVKSNGIVVVKAA